MYTAVISDCGLSYSGETVREISSKLYEYIIETYGPHKVDNILKGSVYASCNIINSPGEYLITPKSDPKNQIYCKIS